MALRIKVGMRPKNFGLPAKGFQETRLRRLGMRRYGFAVASVLPCWSSAPVRRGLPKERGMS